MQIKRTIIPLDGLLRAQYRGVNPFKLQVRATLQIRHEKLKMEQELALGQYALV